MLKKAQEESTAGQVTLDTLAPLNVYSFLLGPSEIAAVEALAKGRVESVRSSLLDCVGEVAKETCPPAKRQKRRTRSSLCRRGTCAPRRRSHLATQRAAPATNRDAGT